MASDPKRIEPIVTIKLSSSSLTGSSDAKVKLRFHNGGQATEIFDNASNIWLYQEKGRITPVIVDIILLDHSPQSNSIATNSVAIELDFTKLPKSGLVAKSAIIQGESGSATQSATVKITFEWFISSDIQDAIEYIVYEMKTNYESREFRDIKQALQLAKQMGTKSLALYHAFDGFDGTFSSAVAFNALAFSQFNAMVRYGGSWDHKKELSSSFGLWFLDAAKGLLYNHDIWSNIHYGWIGRAAGFSAEMLLDAAGIAQAIKQKKQKQAAMAILSNSGKQLDDPDDQVAIYIGIGLWERHGLDLAESDLFQAVRKQSSKLKTRKAPEGIPPASWRKKQR